MANYCKKSSMQEVASAIKSASGNSHAITFPDQFVSRVNNLELVEQKSNPSVTLHKDNTSYTLPKGRYNGGTISVTPEAKTVTPTNAVQSVQASANKALSQVTVSALPGFRVLTGTYDTGSSTIVTSSWTVSGINDFTPMGAVIMKAGLTNTNNICAGVASEKKGSYYGVTTSSSTPGGTLSSGITLGTNSVTITAQFEGVYRYVIWGK